MPRTARQPLRPTRTSILLLAGFLFLPALLWAAAPGDGTRIRYGAPTNVLGRDKYVEFRATQDGQPSVLKVNGETCLAMTQGAGNTGCHRFLYADVEEGFLRNGSGSVEVVVSWRGASMPGLEYDSLDRRLPIGGKYKPAFVRDETGASSSWDLAVFSLPDPQFYDRLNGPADFRLVAEDQVFIAEVRLQRVPPVPPETPVPPVFGREAITRFGSDRVASGLARLPDSPRIQGPGSEAAQGLMMGTGNAAVISCLSLAVDDAFWKASRGTADLAVDVLDQGMRRFFVQYDSGVPGKPYRAAAPIAVRTLENGWKRAFFSLDDAWFANRQNHGGDLRVAGSGLFCLRQVSLRPGKPRKMQPERARRAIRHLFLRFLRRAPDPREERFYTRGLLAGNLSIRECMRKLALSKEFQERHLFSVRFEKAANHLSRLILDRKLTSDELNSLLPLFGQHHFDRVVDAIIDSTDIRLEGKEHVVPGLD